MWALGGGPWTPNIIITSTYKPQQQQPRVNNRQSRGGGEEEEISGLGLAESKEPSHRYAAVKSTVKTKKPPLDKQNQLSGSAVLMALERATVQKAKKRHNKRDDDDDDVPNFKGVARRRRNAGAGVPDLSNVRPLCIKSEWSDRLDELEARLQQELQI